MSTRQRSKSFLVLFYKKGRLAFPSPKDSGNEGPLVGRRMGLQLAWERQRIEFGVAVVLCVAAGALLGGRMWDGLTFLAFSDELAQVLGGRVLDAGGTLYRDFVDSHGPLIFALAQLYGALFGWGHTNGVRVINLMFVAGSFVSLAWSPAVAGGVRRVWAVAILAGLLAAVWLVQGLFMFNYYPIAGALAAIGLTGFACAPAGGGRVHGFAAGVALVLLVASAYSYAPTTVCFAAAGGWGCVLARRVRGLVWFGAGLAAGLAGFLVYLRLFADLHGYLAFHFAENQFVYSHYIGFSRFQFEQSLMLSGKKQDEVQSFGVICAVLACAGMGVRAFWRGEGWRRLPQVLFVLVGLFLLNARGSTQFQDGTFLFASLVAFAAVSANLMGGAGRFALVLPACVVAFVVSSDVVLAHARYSPFNLKRAALDAYHRWPIGDRSDDEFFRRVRGYVGAGGHMLVLTYSPAFYLVADVAPMDGFYTFFKWDADYAKAPWFGRGHDLCAALEVRPPEVIIDDGYPVWGYAPDSYMGCVKQVLSKSYVAEAGGPKPLFVRKDRAGK